MAMFSPGKGSAASQQPLEAGNGAADAGFTGGDPPAIIDPVPAAAGIQSVDLRRPK
jgi:hypothetical protein